MKRHSKKKETIQCFFRIFFFLFFVNLSSITYTVNAQGVSINPSGNSPDSSAMLDVSATNKGLLIPRLTTVQRNAIVSPAEGLQIFNTTTKCLEIFANNVWQSTFCSCTTPVSPSAGTNTPAKTQVTWNWNTVSGAMGYKYNTSNNIATASDNGASTNYTQTGLTCNTAYTLYVWAYNACGNSATATTLSQTTSACCVEATGGTITHVGGNTIHTFASTGAFTTTCAMNVQVLVVGGGGGGSMGGGGAGGFIYNSSFAVNPQSYTVTVGAGGAGKGDGSNGLNGGNSVFSTLTAIGGGGGGGNSINGSAGGSGGGCGIGGVAYTGGAGTSGQGNAGGNSTFSSSPYPTGGGGGAGAAGQNAQTSTQAGAGGAGLSSNISGSTVFYAGGGGGGAQNSGGNGGVGGIGGGGNGCTSCVNGSPGSPGTANTGGGGGAGDAGGSGGAGGSGIVIISYSTP